MSSCARLSVPSRTLKIGISAVKSELTVTLTCCCSGMFYSFKYWYKRRQRILAARRGREKDVERGTSTPLDKLAAVLHLKNKGGSSTGSSSSTGTKEYSFWFTIYGVPAASKSSRPSNTVQSSG